MWASRIWDVVANANSKFALHVASHSYILGAHMNERTLLDNIMHLPYTRHENNMLKDQE